MLTLSVLCGTFVTDNQGSAETIKRTFPASSGGGGAPPVVATDETPAPRGLELIISKYPVTTYVGRTYSFFAEYNGIDVAKDGAWVSSNGNVATVKDGVVLGIAEGETTISYTYRGVTKEQALTVLAPPPTEEPTKARLQFIIYQYPARTYVGENYHIGATYDEQEVTTVAQWESSNETVATIKDGVAIGLTEGETTISVTYNGVTKTQALTVLAPLPTDAPLIWVTGDMDGDCSCNAKDVTILRRKIASTRLTEIDWQVGDVHRDGAINAKDVTALRRKIASGE